MRENLRRQALESGKTLSKKAQTKLSSGTSSKVPSRNVSANVSANVSENGGSGSENNSDSDDGNSTISSFAGDLELELDHLTGTDQPFQQWKSDLRDVIEEITDRKRSSTDGREKSLSKYNYILMHHYALTEIKHQVSEIIPAILKSFKSDSEKETLLACKALELTTFTCTENDLYDSISETLKTAYESSNSLALKAQAIQARTLAAVYLGGSDETEIGEIMTEYLDIIQSDGELISASDSHEVVIAALESWGYLCTFLEDLQDISQEAIEAFAEQLESPYPAIQIAAGQNIALLFEKSYTDTEEDDVDADGSAILTPFTKRYDPYRHKDQLISTLNQIAKNKHRYLRKSERRLLHESFRDILHTVEEPTLGPKYSKSLRTATDRSRLMSAIVGIVGDRKERKFRCVCVDRWWKMQVLHMLKGVLGSGFLVHYRDNVVMEESLPSDIVIIEKSDTKGQRAKWSLRDTMDDDDE